MREVMEVLWCGTQRRYERRSNVSAESVFRRKGRLSVVGELVSCEKTNNCTLGAAMAKLGHHN